MASPKHYSTNPYLTIVAVPGVPISTDEKRLAPMMAKPVIKHDMRTSDDGKRVKCACGASLEIGYEVLEHMMQNGMFNDKLKDLREKKA